MYIAVMFITKLKNFIFKQAETSDDTHILVHKTM